MASVIFGHQTSKLSKSKDNFSFRVWKIFSPQLIPGKGLFKYFHFNIFVSEKINSPKFGLRLHMKSVEQ